MEIEIKGEIKVGARKWDKIYYNLDALTPEDGEEIALKVLIIRRNIKSTCIRDR